MAVVTTKEFASSLAQNLHFIKFGGNSLVCMVRAVVLDVVKKGSRGTVRMWEHKCYLAWLSCRINLRSLKVFVEETYVCLRIGQMKILQFWSGLPLSFVIC